MNTTRRDQLMDGAAAWYPHVKTVWRASVPSTNTLLADEARAGDVSDKVLFAGRQTAGRGRVGRQWWSESADNLYVSARTTCHVPMAHIGLISLGCAVMCVRAIGEGVVIKWPNDLLNTAGQKVGGILCESIPGVGPGACYVLGVGLNLRSAPQLETAASLHVTDEAAASLSLKLAMSLLEVPQWVVNDREGLLHEWRKHAHTLGRTVEISGRRGIATNVDDTGALLLDTAGGPQRILAGDVTMIEHHLEAVHDRSDSLL